MNKQVSECDYCHGVGWVEQPVKRPVTRFKADWSENGYTYKGQRVKYGDKNPDLYETVEVMYDVVDKCPCSL